MSRRIVGLTLEDFGDLLNIARQIHKDKNEPIPELAKENWDKIAFALEAPFQTGFGVPIYRGFINKASILFYMLAKGHRLSNGNKPMACITLDFFCYINDRKLVITDESLITLARYTASSEPLDKDECIENVKSVLRRTIKKKPL